MGVHIIQVMDDHFSIESHGFGDPSCQETTTYIYMVTPLLHNYILGYILTNQLQFIAVL
jgi:hypothetical protein